MINVSINYPPLRERNGIITEYVVSLVQEDDPSFVIQNTIAAVDSGSFYSFTGLTANTGYNIAILSRTSIGDGPAWEIQSRTVEIRECSYYTHRVNTL